jgi:DNA-directed RNA polymerase beta subunit
MLSENYKWNIINEFFKKKGFVSHQVDTFNDYINNGVQRVITESDIVVNLSPDQKYTVSFENIYIPKPSVIEEDRTVRPMFPSEARQRDLTYDSPIFVDVIEKTETDGKDPEITVHNRIIIGRTPIMLLSDKCNLKKLTLKERVDKGECEKDYGGYFIIRGKERALVGQLRGVYNQPIVLLQKPNDKWKYVCEVRSMSEETGHSVLLQAKIGVNDRSIVFNIPYIKEIIPVGILFKALGFLTEEEISNIIGNKDNNEKIKKYIKFIIRDSYHIKTQEDALKYISQFTVHVIKDDKKIDYTTQVVENELLPHMGIFATIKEKSYFLGMMVNKLLCTYIGIRKEDDRDNYSNKRVEMAGVLCCELFRTLFKRFIKSIVMQLEKKKQYPDIINIISRTSGITSGLKSCFCFVAGTNISMGNGTSYPIEKLVTEKNKQELIGWENTGFIRTVHGGVIKQGIKDVIKLTLQDGRTIKCTPDHKILIMKDKEIFEWVEALKIPINSKIVTGLDYPLDNLEEENEKWCLTINYTNGYNQNIVKKWKIDSLIEREKTLAFMRILGLVLSDGSLCKNKSDCTVFLGNKFDVETFISDYSLISGIEKSDVNVIDRFSEKWGDSYNIKLKSDLYHMITSLDGVNKGKKVETCRQLPKFILNDDCPKSVIREFLGGLFGGDGSCPRLDIRKNKKTCFEGVKFSWSSSPEYFNDLKITMNNLCKLLEKLGINGSLINGPYYHEETLNPYIRITLRPNTDFINKIGFRYCIYKSYKLSVISSYWRFIEQIKRQHDTVIKRVNYLKDTEKISLRKSLEIAQKEMKSDEFILNSYYSLSTFKAVSKRRVFNRPNELGCLKSNFGVPDAKDFIEELGCLEWFIEKNKYVCSRDATKLPFFCLKLMDIRFCEPEIVYDIVNVKETSSFLANGICSSNSTGSWSVTRNNYVRTGVSQVLSRLTFAATLSHLRRVVIPIGKEGKNSKIRQIHSSQIMYICNCVTGDTEVLLGDNKTVKFIKDLKEGVDEIMTINPVTLEKEKSAFYNKFSILPEQIYEVKTMSGRKVKCTPEHPFLIKRRGKIQWIEAKDLDYTDLMCIKHYTKYLPDNDGRLLSVALNGGNLNSSIKLSETCARLFALFLSSRYKDRIISFSSRNDMDEVIDDIISIGIKRPACRIGSECSIIITKDLLNFMIEIGFDYSNRFGKSLPKWLIESPSSVKREFISAFQGCNGGSLYYNEEFENILMSGTSICDVDVDDESQCIVACQISEMFTQFNIKNKISKVKKMVNNLNFRNFIVIEIENNPMNLVAYSDIVWFRYSEDKVRIGSMLLEFLKTFLVTKEEISLSIFKQKSSSGIDDIILNPILSIKKNIPLEPVYDLTTRSGNHSFMVNSVVGSNCETPEGQSIGIVMNLALSTLVTRRIPTVVVKEIIESSKNIIFINDYDGINDKPKIFLNGILMGITENADEFINEMKDFRKNGLLDKEISITFDDVDNEIKLYCDEGRFIRPLLTVNEDGIPNIYKYYEEHKETKIPDWDEMIEKQFVSYVDNSEIQSYVIAMDDNDLKKRKNDLFEICPSMILGVMASGIPFPDHNQSPRNIYQCLCPETDVLMFDGTRKAIKNVKNGDKVITFDPKTLKISTTKVINQYVRETTQKIYKIKTTSGREIIATENHPFMTPDGWCKVGDMNGLTKIGICLKYSEIRDKEEKLERINGCIFVNIESIREVPNQMISDITVEHQNHSFIAGNGFLSSNSSMGKQAMGMFALSHQIRTDTIAHVLDYPQRPLVNTIPADIMGFNDMPSGINAIVAIATYTGLTLVEPLSC